MASQGSVKVEIANLPEVRQRLKALGEAAGLDAIKKSLEKAVEPIIEAAKANVADDPVIQSGIQVINLEPKGPAAMHAEVGLPGGRRPWFYGLFREKGTGPRTQKTTGRSTGSMPADPFLRPAYDANKGRAQAEFGKELARILEMHAGG